MSNEQSITKTENTWLLRVMASMGGFISIVVVLFLNTILTRLENIAEFKTQTVADIRELNTWRKTFDEAQKTLQGDVSNLINQNKLYALKPDEIIVKRKIK